MLKSTIVAIFLLLGFTVVAEDSTTAQISVFDSRVYRNLFGTEVMREIFSDYAMVKQWLKVEVALAKAQARLGIIPASAAVAIEAAAKIDNIDFNRLRQDTAIVGRGINPLLLQLKASGGEEVAKYLHWGSTTQDIMDTATVLQVTAGIELIKTELIRLVLQLADLAEEHKNTVMLARTNGQDAVPTTFGLHLTTYIMALHRHAQRLDEAKYRLEAQIGGTAGNLAAFPDLGIELQQQVAIELGVSPHLRHGIQVGIILRR